MLTLIQTQSERSSYAPRLVPGWRDGLRRLLAIDALFRERRMMASLDPRLLRDIGVARADIDAALRRPHEHLRSILLRNPHDL